MCQRAWQSFAMLRACFCARQLRLSCAQLRTRLESSWKPPRYRVHGVAPLVTLVSSSSTEDYPTMIYACVQTEIEIESGPLSLSLCLSLSLSRALSLVVLVPVHPRLQLRWDAHHGTFPDRCRGLSARVVECQGSARNGGREGGARSFLLGKEAADLDLEPSTTLPSLRRAVEETAHVLSYT